MTPIGTFIKNYQSLVVSGALILFCVIATVFAVVPAIGSVQNIFRDLKDLSDQTNLLKNKLNALNSFEETELRTKLSNVLSAVPADRSFPTLFSTVEGVAASTGVTIMNMSLSGGATLATPSATQVTATDKKLGTRTIPFSVTINGSLDAIEQFIAQVPNVRRLLRIRVFSIAFPKEDRPLTISIDMDAFYEPLPSSIGSAKNALPVITEDDEAVIARLSGMPLVSEENGSLPAPLIGKVKEDPFSP